MKIKGFTLIELVIVLAVLALLSLLSTGSSTQLISNNEKQAVIDDIRTLVQYARIQAVSNGHQVYLSPLNPDLNWSKGIILSRFNPHLNREEVIHTRQWNLRYWEVSWSGVNTGKKIIFANNTSNSISNGTFTLSNVRTHDKISITLNRVGRIRVSQKYRRSLV